MQYNVAIIGGGAAGVVAAIAAKRRGGEVIILDKNQKLGRKILATGNGRCNLGNEDLSLKHFVSTDLALAEQVLQQFDGQIAAEFFRRLGLEYACEEGRLYPRSKQAVSVVQVLLHELSHLGVHTELEAPVTSLAPLYRGFTLTYGQSKSLGARAVILATGGKAGPQLGSSGDGYTFAQRLGHTLVEPTPALVGLRLKCPYLKTLAGLRLQAKVTIPELKLSELGEVIFTDYGLSGIPVFDLTRAIGPRHGLTLRINLCPELESEAELYQLLWHRVKSLAHKDVAEALVGFLPRQLIVPVLKEAGLAPEGPAGSLAGGAVARLRDVLWSWDLPIVSLNTWEQAQTTYGGVPLTEVDPTSLESRLVKGLHFAGEILDVHGRCGGYNLHWAWASGFVAGTNAGS